MAPPLPELLTQLEDRLRAFGAPIAEAFRPGAPPEHVEAVLAGEGLRAHPDLVTWWGWHDGAAVDAPPVEAGPGIYYRADNTLVGGWHVLSLAEAVRIRRWFRQEHDQLGISHLFPISWIPVFDTDGAGELCADTAGAGPAPLHVLDEGYIEPPPPHFASLADFVQTAIRAFDAGLVRLSAVRPGAPSLDDSALEGDLRRLAYW